MGFINPYYWVDDHPLLYGNNGSLDPSTFGFFGVTDRVETPPFPLRTPERPDGFC